MTEPPKLFVGTDDFKALLVNSNVFVDKSLMIKELLEDPGAIVLITRLRRLGQNPEHGYDETFSRNRSR